MNAIEKYLLENKEARKEEGKTLNNELLKTISYEVMVILTFFLVHYVFAIFSLFKTLKRTNRVCHELVRIVMIIWVHDMRRLNVEGA